MRMYLHVIIAIAVKMNIKTYEYRLCFNEKRYVCQ